MIYIDLRTISSILSKSINLFLLLEDLLESPTPPKAGNKELMMEPNVPGMENA